MMQAKKGCFCKSLAGHDTNTYYIIVEDEKGIWVCDGKIKKLSNPKRKNPKHLELLETRDETIERKITDGSIKDEDIKYSIKNILKRNDK